MVSNFWLVLIYWVTPYKTEKIATIKTSINDTEAFINKGFLSFFHLEVSKQDDNLENAEIYWCDETAL